MDVVFDPEFKIYGMAYGLELAHKKVLANGSSFEQFRFDLRREFSSNC